MMQSLARLVLDESGQGMVEYGVLVASIAFAAVMMLGTLNMALGSIFTGVEAKM